MRMAQSKRASGTIVSGTRELSSIKTLMSPTSGWPNRPKTVKNDDCSEIHLSFLLIHLK